MITQNRLKEILDYDPNTGMFTRLVRTSPISPAGEVAGTLRSTGYINIAVKGEKYYAHRLAWLYVYGEWPKDQIDHINHDRADNRIVNLREVTCSENGQNRVIGKNNTSGFIGVTWSKTCNKWQVQITNKGKHTYLGAYTTIIDAVAARMRANKEHNFHENHGGIL